MVLSLVVINEMKKLHNRYDGHYRGLFVTKTGFRSNIRYIKRR